MSTPEMPETDVADLIRDVNATNDAVEDQCLRARQAADAAIRSDQAAEDAKAAALAAAIAYQTIQAERPAAALAAAAAGVPCAAGRGRIDGVACYFAAQALDGSQDSHPDLDGHCSSPILLAEEIGLDFYRDRNLRAWRTPGDPSPRNFVALLGVLRFWFLADHRNRRPDRGLRRGGSVHRGNGRLLLRSATGPCAPPRHRRPGAPAGRRARPRTPRERPRVPAARAGRRRTRPPHRCLPRHVRKVVLKTCAVERAAGRGARGARPPVRKVPLDEGARELRHPCGS